MFAAELHLLGLAGDDQCRAAFTFTLLARIIAFGRQLMITCGTFKLDRHHISQFAATKNLPMKKNKSNSVISNIQYLRY
jgi:hypothetical protein